MNPRTNLALVASLVALAILLAPMTAQAGNPGGILLIVYSVECTGKRCPATLRMAMMDRITSLVASSRRYKPVDRANLGKAMQEQLACRSGINKGIISKECRIEVGRVMQAQKMLNTRVVSMGAKNFQITLSITDLATVKKERGVSQICRKCDHLELLAATDKAMRRLLGSAAAPRVAPRRSAPPMALPSGTTTPRQPEVDAPPVAAEVGMLRVEGKPRGARVDVTGPKGFKGPKAAVLPATWSGVPAGDYRVKASLRDHDAVERTVRVLPERTGLVTVDLPLTYGHLEVRGTPPGAKVTVSGPHGYKVTFGLGGRVKNLRRGDYTVTASRAGYGRVNRKVSVVGGKTSEVTVDLQELGVTSAGPSSEMQSGRSQPGPDLRLSSWLYFSDLDNRYHKPSAHRNTFERHKYGICFWSPGSRKAGYVHTRRAFEVRGKTIRIKWQANGKGGFMGCHPGVLPELQRNPRAATEVGYLSTGNAYGGSVKIREDTWYYTRIKVTSDGQYTAVTSAIDFDDKEGRTIQSRTGKFSPGKQRIWMRQGDPHAGPGVWIIIGGISLK